MSLTSDLAVRLTSARAALADRQVARLLLVWGAWVTTDWAFLITVSVLALDAGGPAAVGLVGAARVIPAAALSGLGSTISDRLPRPLLIALVNAAWAVVALLMAWFALIEVEINVLLIVIGIGSAASSLLKPCLQAMLPQLVQSPSQLIVANSAFSTIEGAGTILGPALCGVLLAASGPPAVFVALALLYTGAAVVGRMITTPFRPARRVPGQRALVWSDAVAGVRVLTAPGIRVVFGLFMVQTLMRGLLNVFVILVATSGPGGSEARAGTLFAAIGVGGLLGAITGLSGSDNKRGAAWFARGIGLWGVPVAVIGFWPQPGVAWVALAVLGFGNALADIHGYSLMGRLFPDHLSGRAWGAFQGIGAGAVAVGSIAAPLLAGSIGLGWAMIITGTALALAPILLWSRVKLAATTAGGRPEDLELLRQVPLFDPLSLIPLERLARASDEVRVPAGTVVVRQHDAATQFFVIADGELAVRQDDHEIRRIGRGASFGEIGLLDGVPRTASVVALQESRLLCLNAEAFVAAVTGHRPTDELARHTVDDLRTEDARRSEEHL